VGISSSRDSYFPLAAGSEWEYRLVTTFERSNRVDTTTIAFYRHRIVGGTTLADGRPAWIRVWESQVTLRDTVLPESSFVEAETTYFRATKHAIYRYLKPDSKPDSILLLPMAIDQRWQSEGIVYWVAGKEDVTIDGRNYPECWLLHSGPPPELSPMKTWFARGVGLVRMASDRIFSGKHLRTEYYLVRAEIK
jgi:hypothetical protein